MGKDTKKVVGLRVSPNQRGFTLVEVLVVLAILVILFGLLFAPMMAGMDMATNGRALARLQDAARLASEQMRRELADAMYVYPPPTINVGTGVVTDYSQIVFVPPARDVNGSILTPRQPRTDPVTGQILVTRYYVRPPSTANGAVYDASNPFTLVRQEGLYRLNPATGQYEFGSVDPSTNSFVVGRALSENVLMPDENYDIPATTTICLNCGQMVVGYVDKCPNCGSTDLVYLHRDVQFTPDRISNEALAPSQNDSVYTASHGNWMGTPDNGTVFLSNTPLSSTASEMQPRLVAYQWETLTGPPATSGYTQIALDTATSVRSNIKLRWNSAAGTVQIGEYHTSHISADLSSPPTALAGTYWPITVDGDKYNSNGQLSSGTPTSPLVPIYPAPPTQWSEPRMPIAYQIEPGRSDGTTLIPAKIVPNSSSVVVTATSGNNIRRAQYTLVQNINQSELGPQEYGEYLLDNQRGGELRFDRFSPPSPDLFDLSQISAFDIYITYYYRRNFDPVSNRDDVLYANYSTGEVINLTVIPQRYTDLDTLPSGGKVVPANLPLGGVPIHTQAVIRNAQR